MSSGRTRSPAEPVQLAITESGFTVGETMIAWNNVSEIWGYKIDLVTTDEAFLQFSFDGQSISVSEEDPDFDALESAMAVAFPSTATWREAVLQPAFAPCRTMLYRRD
jgi:hypothetical protein